MGNIYEITTLALLTAALYFFAASRYIIASGLAGLASLILSDIYVHLIRGSSYVEAIPELLLLYAAYIGLAVSFLKYSSNVEEKPRLPGVFTGILAVILLASMYYGLKMANMAELVCYTIAVISAMLLIVFLVRDVAKIGLGLLACVHYAHGVIPEQFVGYMLFTSIICTIVVGTIVYYAYREFGSRNIDVLVKLRY